MKRIKLVAALLVVAVLGVTIFAPVASVGALDPLAGVCDSGTAGTVCDNQDENAEDLIGVLVNTLLFIIGILSVIMIIVSGIFYVISTGDAGKVAKAKNTLMYSIVGLVIAFIAFALVNWVFNLFQ
ncbi:MAG: hypothetical protein ACREGE_02560 [Candidatus Microsaccharimonas sp.]